MQPLTAFRIAGRAVAQNPKPIASVSPRPKESILRCLAALIFSSAALLAGCGDGDTHSSSPVRKLSAAISAEPQSEDIVNSAALFQFAQQTFPTVFSGSPPTEFIGPYEYRYYSATGIYLGFSGYEVYLLGPTTDGVVAKIGTMQDYACAAFPSDCAQRTVRPSMTVGQTSYSNDVVISTISTPMIVPESSPRSVGKQYFFRYVSPRSFVAVDVTGDGLDDIVVAPTFWDHGPSLRLEIWVNRGDGTFSNQTSTLFDGPAPIVSASTALMVADFNHDGRPDIFIVDSGLEEYICTVETPCAGAKNVLILSQPNDKLKDVSDTHLTRNSARFNHVVSAVGDVNGDGHIDIAVPTLGGRDADGSGVLLWINDGTGHLTERSADLLDDEVGYRPSNFIYSPERARDYDPHNAGATALVDLDGDGRAELVTCSHYLKDRFSQLRTVRIHKWDAKLGRLVQVAKFPQPAATAAVDAGCSGVAPGDIDGDGKIDLVMTWEANNGNNQAEVERNLGGWRFEDVTVTAVGSSRTAYVGGGFTWPVMGTTLRDINGDGRPDITRHVYSVFPSQLASGMPTAAINDGNGRFAPQRITVSGANVNEAQIVALLKTEAWKGYLPLYGRFLPGSGPLDLALLNSNTTFPTLMQESEVVIRVLRGTGR